MTDAQRKHQFAELLRQHQSRVVGFIYSLVRDINDADDLFQQTTLILWNKFGDYDPTRSFLSWACGVARLEVSNFIRSRSRRKLYLADDLTLMLIEAAEEEEPTDPDDDRRRAALGQCVDKLRERDRELLTACYGEAEETITAVADRLGRSSQSVHNSLKRIREALYECVRRTMAQAAHPKPA
ncbi:MAG TPA: sigma-70 family RNA polymerase sigma factor [Humisphaera sp.]